MGVGLPRERSIRVRGGAADTGILVVGAVDARGFYESAGGNGNALVVDRCRRFQRAYPLLLRLKALSNADVVGSEIAHRRV